MATEPTTLIHDLLHAGKPQQAMLLVAVSRMEEQADHSEGEHDPWLFMLYRAMPTGEVVVFGHEVATQLMAPQAIGILDEASMGLGLRIFGESLATAGRHVNFVPVLGPDMVAWVLIREIAGGRQVLAVDRVGVRYQVQRGKGGEPLAALDESKEHSTLGGELFDSLAELMDKTP